MSTHLAIKKKHPKDLTLGMNCKYWGCRELCDRQCDNYYGGKHSDHCQTVEQDVNAGVLMEAQWRRNN